MHTQALNAPNGSQLTIVGLVSYNDLRAMAISLRTLAIISRDALVEIYDYEPTDVRPDTGDGLVIKPDSVAFLDPGRWVRKPTFGSGGGGGGGGVSDHGALTGLADDDHPQYTLTAEAQALIDAAIAAHEAMLDPHPLYALDSDLAAHVAAADPHTGYQKESEKSVAGGYASLDGGVKVPVAELPDATTTAKGIVELATDGENAPNVVVQGNDSRINGGQGVAWGDFLIHAE